MIVFLRAPWLDPILWRAARRQEPGGAGGSPPDSHHQLRTVARLCGAGVVVEGLAVLAAWMLGFGNASSLFSELPPMHPNTALMSVLAGTSLLLQAPLRPGRIAAFCARVLAVGVVALSGIGLGTLLFATTGFPFPVPSAPQTAEAFLLLGVGLCGFDYRTLRGRRPAVGLALAAGSLVLIAGLGHLFRVGFLYGRPGLLPKVGMAIPTMVALLLLCGGVMIARPETGIMATLLSADAGGVAVRRLLSRMAALAPATALIAVAERRAWLDPPFAAALIAFLAIAGGLASILTTGGQVNRFAAARRESDQRARELLDQASEGIFVADLSGRYIDVNFAGCRMLGYTREEILGRTIMDLIPPEDVPRLSRAKEDLLLQRPHVEEWKLRRKDGTYLLAEVSAKILPDGRWQGFVRDVTGRKQAEEELRRIQEQERFRAALEAASSAMVVVDREGRIAFVNGEAERLLGWTRDELRGQKVEVLVPSPARRIHPLHREAFLQEAGGKRAMGAGRALWAVRRDGSTLPVEISLTRVEERGETFVVASMTDVSVRLAAESALLESEQRFRLLVQGTRDYAIFMHDPEGRITVWNEGAERILGYVTREILGQSFHRFYLSEEAAQGRPELDLRRAVEQGSLEVEGWRVRKDGSRFWAGVLITPILDPAGRILGYGKVIRDLSERRNREDELRESEARLKRTILELEGFAYTVSHDLRSPLRAIQGYAHFLADRLSTGADVESRDMLLRIERAAVRLDHLIRDLLSFSAISQTEILLEVVDLDEILGHVAGHYPELSKVLLRVRTPLGRVRGQTSLLIQAVSNLLDNAVKFVPSDRVPEVEVWSERLEGGRRALVIQDNGIGIPRESWEAVFKPFTRLHPREAFEGTGIGLAIVKRGVERMGGCVTLDSEPGRGSRFRIELPEA